MTHHRLRLKAKPDLAELLDALDPQAELVQRHLWLIALFEWLRGDCQSVTTSLSRLELLLNALQADPGMQARLQAWWLAALEEPTLARIQALLQLPGSPEAANSRPELSQWQCTVIVPAHKD